MKTQTKLAISSLLSAAGAVLTALSAEFAGESTTATEPSTPADPPTTKRTRKGAAAVPAVADPTPDPETPEEPATETAEIPSGVMTFDELKALIEPFVKNNQGADVKKLIAKYDPDSATPSIKTMPAKNHAAFEKDIQALGY